MLVVSSLKLVAHFVISHHSWPKCDCHIFCLCHNCRIKHGYFGELHYLCVSAVAQRHLTELKVCKNKPKLKYKSKAKLSCPISPCNLFCFTFGIRAH